MKEKYVKNGRGWQIYSKRVWIRKDKKKKKKKKKKDEGKNEEWYKGKG